MDLVDYGCLNCTTLIQTEAYKNRGITQPEKLTNRHSLLLHMFLKSLNTRPLSLTSEETDENHATVS